MRSVARTSGRAAAAAALSGVLVLSACSPRGDDDHAGMDVWMYQDDLAVVQEAAIEEFNTGSTVHARMIPVPGDGYQDKLRTAMGSGDVPDVFFNWGGGSIRPYVEADKLLPLDDALAADPELADAFLPSVMEAGQIDGVQYGIPLRGTQPVILFYNKDVFAEAGVEPPQTWQDLLDLVDTFTEEDITPFALAGAEGWPQQMWLQYLVDRLGGPEVFGRIQDGDPEGWRDPVVLEAARTVSDLVDRGAFGDNFASVNYTQGGAPTLLAQGRAAMHLMGSWEYSTQLSQAPEFAEDGLGYLPFPALPDGEGDPANVVGNPTNYFSVGADTDHPDEAVAFLKLTSSPDYVRDMVANGEVPTTANAADLLADSPSPDFAEFQYQLVQDAPAFQLSWDQALESRIANPMKTEIQKLFNGQSTPEQFVDAVAALR
ncbi:ABC transporter substrate-binding protein [Nocardiopsis ansamitocini]|uniref:Sugar-binding protein n=1 Tax=Nocardiopsis ansamitocini TaxID=1670832 RepID=A0A9W6P7Q2_9ACTN|nr:extracellular solute-binding protein [Nocardiopsis ansamitocini]GLU48594.1 sugar-binding protein [Nocardiopsis ansamitocini]